MPPIGYVVFNAKGKAGIHCGEDSEGNELVAWIGTPYVVSAKVDEKGDGTPAYSTSFPAATDEA